MKQKHTPLHWEISEKYSSEILFQDHLIAVVAKQNIRDKICSEAESNAEFIVRACNSFYDLITVLENAHQEVLKLAKERDPGQLGMWDAIFNSAKTTLAKAKGDA